MVDVDLHINSYYGLLGPIQLSFADDDFNGYDCTSARSYLQSSQANSLSPSLKDRSLIYNYKLLGANGWAECHLHDDN